MAFDDEIAELSALTEYSKRGVAECEVWGNGYIEVRFHDDDLSIALGGYLNEVYFNNRCIFRNTANERWKVTHGVGATIYVEDTVPGLKHANFVSWTACHGILQLRLLD